MILGCTPILGNLHMCKRCQDVHGPRVVNFGVTENCVQSIGPSFAIFRILFPLVQALQASYQPSLQLGTNAVTSMQWLIGSTASCLWPVRGYIWILMFLGITMTFPQNGGFVWHDFSNQFHSSVLVAAVCLGKTRGRWRLLPTNSSSGSLAFQRQVDQWQERQDAAGPKQVLQITLLDQANSCFKCTDPISNCAHWAAVSPCKMFRPDKLLQTSKITSTVRGMQQRGSPATRPMMLPEKNATEAMLKPTYIPSCFFSAAFEPQTWLTWLRFWLQIVETGTRNSHSHTDSCDTGCHFIMSSQPYQKPVLSSDSVLLKIHTPFRLLRAAASVPHAIVKPPWDGKVEEKEEVVVVEGDKSPPALISFDFGDRSNMVKAFCFWTQYPRIRSVLWISLVLVMYGNVAAMPSLHILMFMI